MAAKANFHHNPSRKADTAISRIWVPQTLLARSRDVERAKEWQRARDAALTNLANLTEMSVKELGDVPAGKGIMLSRFSDLYETNAVVQARGAETATKDEINKIHSNYVAISTWAHPRLIALGRSTRCIAPMIAMPLCRTTLELDLTDVDVKFPLTRTTDGFSAFIHDGKSLSGADRFFEIGSLGNSFGLLCVFKGQWIKNEAGERFQDSVKACVVDGRDGCHGADGTIFNTTVAGDNGDVVRAMVENVLETLRADPQAVWGAIKKARSLYGEKVVNTAQRVRSGNVAAKKAVAAAITASENQPEEMVAEGSAHAAACALANPVATGEVSACRSLTTVVVPVEETKVEVIGGADFDAAEKALTQEPIVAALPEKKRTWYAVVHGCIQRKRCAQKPGPQWKSKKPVLPPVAQVDIDAGHAAAKEIALDDAVASAVANSPEAAEVMKSIEDEKQRRATASAVVVDAEVIVGAAPSGLKDVDVDGTIVLADEHDGEIITGNDADGVDFLFHHEDEIILTPGTQTIAGKTVKVLLVNGGAQIAAVCNGSDPLMITTFPGIENATTFGDAFRMSEPATK